MILNLPQSPEVFLNVEDAGVLLILHSCQLVDIHHREVESRVVDGNGSHLWSLVCAGHWALDSRHVAM